MRECEEIMQNALKEGCYSLFISEAQQICELHHIKTPESCLAKTVEDVLEKQMEYPVVFEIVSPDSA